MNIIKRYPYLSAIVTGYFVPANLPEDFEALPSLLPSKEHLLSFKTNDKVDSFHKSLAAVFNRQPENHEVYLVDFNGNKYYIGFSDFSMSVSQEIRLTNYSVGQPIDEAVVR